MADARELVVVVPIRCCAPENPLAPMAICREPARWERPGAAIGAAHFCDRHRDWTDVPIVDVAIVRRISICVEAVFNSTRAGRSASEAEAVTRLLEAVAAAGGVMSLVAVTSDVGRQAVPAPAGVKRRSGHVG